MESSRGAFIPDQDNLLGEDPLPLVPESLRPLQAKSNMKSASSLTDTPFLGWNQILVRVIIEAIMKPANLTSTLGKYPPSMPL